jgi:hypothetical protein
MDQSLLARSMLFSTIVVLPVVAAFIVLDRIVCFCITLTLGILSWKYRPRIKEPSVPTQLFE